MTQGDKYVAFLLERIASASSPETRAAYEICHSAFTKLYQVDVEVELIKQRHDYTIDEEYVDLKADPHNYQPYKKKSRAGNNRKKRKKRRK